MDLFSTEDVLLRLAFLKVAACGREDWNAAKRSVASPAVTSERDCSVERHLLSVTGKKMLGASKYSDALLISVRAPGK